MVMEVSSHVHLVTFDTLKEAEHFAREFPRAARYEQDGKFVFVVTSGYSDIREYEEKQYKSKPEHFESHAHYVAHKLHKNVFHNQSFCYMTVRDGRIQLHVTHPCRYNQYKEGFMDTPVDIVKSEKIVVRVGGPR